MKEQFNPGKTEEKIVFSKPKQKIIDNLLEQWNEHNTKLKVIEAKIEAALRDSNNKDLPLKGDDRIFAEQSAHEFPELEKEKQILADLEKQLIKHQQ